MRVFIVRGLPNLRAAQGLGLLLRGQHARLDQQANLLFRFGQCRNDMGCGDTPNAFFRLCQIVPGGCLLATILPVRIANRTEIPTCVSGAANGDFLGV